VTIIQAPSSAPPVFVRKVRHTTAAPLQARLPAAEADRLFREFFVSRDPEIRERLVNAHIGLAASLAQRFGSRPELHDDLHQAALLGLLHAIDRFDPTRGVQFTTFAWATISGELKRHFRDRTWGVRVPRRVQELYLTTAEAMDALTNSLGRSPTVAEVAARIGASEEEVVEALEARTAYRLASIDTPTGDGDDTGTSMQLGSTDPGYQVVEQRSMLSSLVNKLPAREREIIHLRFNEELTQAEIADRIGVSQMHVSRLLSTSLAKLRVLADENRELGARSNPSR
jgi:RNA polymerase sigma-B factor